MASPQAEESPEVAGPFRGPRADIGRRARSTDTVIIVAAVVAGLYFGHEVLVPIALAVLLSFVLAPVVEALATLRIGRIASVLCAVFFAFAILVGLGAIIGRQVAQLGEDLPEYKAVIGKKMETLRSSGFSKGIVEKAADALNGLDARIGRPAAQPKAAPSNGAATPSPKPPIMQVEVHEPAPGPVQIVQSILSALLPPLATAAIVVVFVIFILLQRGDLRDRLIGLTGAHDLHRTTQALDDAAFRLSRYFLALTTINGAFGLAIAIGLSLVGVPNPILWGIVGAVLRFVPYIGAVIAAAFPLALAAAVDPGWSMVAETALLFVALETLMGQVVEPHLFGHTTGMSPLAVIVAAAFWTLIWGPAGLLLSTPITACLVVLGRHVESLNFIELLLGDKPALSPVQSFYQRILASDPDEVAFQAEALLKTMPLVQYYETVALPALALAQADVARGVLDADRQAEVCAAVEHVVEDLADHVDPDPDEGESEVVARAIPAASDPAPDAGGREAAEEALCLAGRTPLDRAACAILAQLLERRAVPARVAGQQALTTGGIFALRADGVRVICIVSLDHLKIAPIRYSVRRLRKKFPHIPIAVCLWGSRELAAKGEAVHADATVGALQDALDFCAPPPPPREAAEIGDALVQPPAA
jgi:predicted PurR-regulated permease PerM